MLISCADDISLIFPFLSLGTLKQEKDDTGKGREAGGSNSNCTPRHHVSMTSIRGKIGSDQKALPTKQPGGPELPTNISPWASRVNFARFLQIKTAQGLLDTHVSTPR